eukprot:2045015-Pyramimonas_sp.AAC.1
MATASQMDGGWFSKYGSNLSAAHTRFKDLQELHGLRAGGFQNVALAMAPRTFVFKISKSFTD